MEGRKMTNIKFPDILSEKNLFKIFGSEMVSNNLMFDAGKIIEQETQFLEKFSWREEK
jgi:hypothetical protein